MKTVWRRIGTSCIITVVAYEYGVTRQVNSSPILIGLDQNNLYPFGYKPQAGVVEAKLYRIYREVGALA